MSFSSTVCFCFFCLSLSLEEKVMGGSIHKGLSTIIKIVLTDVLDEFQVPESIYQKTFQALAASPDPAYITL